MSVGFYGRIRVDTYRWCSNIDSMFQYCVPALWYSACFMVYSLRCILVLCPLILSLFMVKVGWCVHLSCCYCEWACAWQNWQNDLCTSKYTDQPGHPPSLLRVFAVCSMGSCGPNVSSAKTLIGLGRCPGWFGSLLGTQVISLVLSCYGPNVLPWSRVLSSY